MAIPYDHYLNYQEVAEELTKLAAAFPDLVAISSIGKSYEGRDILLATVTDRRTGDHSEKPAFWIDGNIHATEVSAASACLHFISDLTGKYGSDENVTRCLRTRTYYIVPRMNPDGAELYFAKNPKYLRSSVRPYPFDEEPIAGLDRCDIDGDGRILTMRILDPNGAWKEHPADSRLMLRRDPIETGGKYYRLLPEGRVENYNGTNITVPPAKEGLDLNRNFPGHWRMEKEQYGAGPYPTSEPEVHAVVDFICSHPNITGGVTFHTFSGVLLRPYGTQDDTSMPAEDLWTYQTIGKKGTEITGYPAISVYHDFKYHPKEVITGVFDDWMYDHLGLYAWTIEIWSPQRQAGLKEFGPERPAGGFRFIDWSRDHSIEDDFKMLEWNDTALEGKGVIPWYPFEHPELGSIDLGGWDAIYAFRNPPPQFLEKELSLFPEWLVWHALIAPELSVHTAATERVGDDTWNVVLVVSNSGWLPTYISKQGRKNESSRGVIAEIELPENVSMVTGLKRLQGTHLEGRAYKSAGAWGWTADPTDDRCRFEWWVKGDAGSTVSITARQDKAGAVTVDLTLN